jgi:hypothetical protein
MAQSNATKDNRTDQANLYPENVNINISALKKTPRQSGFSKTEIHPASSVSLRSKKSGFANNDLSVPINSAIFFQHSNQRLIEEDYEIGEVLGQGAYG